jgi:hypothetical protein
MPPVVDFPRRRFERTSGLLAEKLKSRLLGSVSDLRGGHILDPLVVYCPCQTVIGDLRSGANRKVVRGERAVGDTPPARFWKNSSSAGGTSVSRYVDSITTETMNWVENRGMFDADKKKIWVEFRSMCKLIK